MGKQFKTLYIVKKRDLEDSLSVEVNNLYAAHHRGHDVHVVYPKDLFVKHNELYAITRQPNAAKLSSIESFVEYLKNPQFMLDNRVPVRDFDIIFSRTVPKTREESLSDNAVINYLQCMKTLYPGIAFINDPDAISKAGSKIYDSLVLGDTLPDTHITKDEVRIKEILKKGDEWIAKPVHGLGGTDIIGINKDYKKNLGALIQLLLRDLYSSTDEPRPFILQDKLEGLERRLVLLNGSEIVGSYGKILSEDDIRGNSEMGATYTDYDPTEIDLKLVSKIAPILQSDGLYLTAADILGPENKANLKNTKILELNARCPQWSKGIKDWSKIGEISDKIIQFAEDLHAEKN